MKFRLHINNSSEQEKVQNKIHVLETLLVIAGFAIVTYSNPHGKTTVMSALFGISIYAFILFDLLIIGFSTVHNSASLFTDDDMDELYFPLVLTFSSMLLLYFFSLGTFTIDKAFLEQILPNFGEVIYRFWMYSYFFTTVSVLSNVLLISLNSRFAESCKKLSKKDNILIAIIFCALVILSNIKTGFAPIALSLLILITLVINKYYLFLDNFSYAFKRICLIFIVVSFIAMVLNLGGPLSQQEPEIIRGNLSIAIDNVRFIYNNTTVNLQNYTLSFDNFSTTINS